jgi:hypothetical protein
MAGGPREILYYKSEAPSYKHHLIRDMMQKVQAHTDIRHSYDLPLINSSFIFSYFLLLSLIDGVVIVYHLNLYHPRSSFNHMEC